MKVYSSDQFFYHSDTAEFTVDVSDLGGTAAAQQTGWQVDSQVYNDAADSGFAICSVKTGKFAIYTLHDIARDREGDIQAWEYHPARRHESMMCSKGDIADWDSYKHTKVTIFND